MDEEIHKVCLTHFFINIDTFDTFIFAVSQSSTVSGVSGVSSNSRVAPKPQPTQTQSSVIEDAEDTMKNLRKTFAGIFGDM